MVPHRLCPLVNFCCKSSNDLEGPMSTIGFYRRSSALKNWVSSSLCSQPDLVSVNVDETVSGYVFPLPFEFTTAKFAEG